MKLTEQQIEAIYQCLEKDKIFYDDIRHEMTDHIATTLEEHLSQTGDDFNTALNAYMNSHAKVKLLTAVRQQEVMRDKKYRNTLFRQLISVKGLIMVAIVFGITIFSTVEIWAFRCIIGFVMVLNMFYLTFEPWVGPRYYFIRRINNVSLFQHMFLAMVVLQGQRIVGDTPLVQVVTAIVLSVLLTSYYLLVRMSNTILREKKKYA